MSGVPLLIDPEAPVNPPVGRRDLLVASGYAALVLVLAASGAHNSGFLLQGQGWPVWVSVTLMLVGCVSLIWRRRRPAVTLAVAGPLGLAEIIVGGQISAYILLFEALFDPVMHGSRRLAHLTTRIAIVGTALALLAALIAGLPGQVVFVIAMVATLVVMTPLLWGWEVRHHRGARQAAEQLAGLEHELAASRAAHAVETERRSIAHDLHDVIAGHLSAVSLHTNLASALEDPAARDRSLTTARDSAHAALRDLRSMIGVLSTEQSDALPAVTLDWPSLTARLRDRDADAQVQISPAVTDPSRVEPAVQAALLRIGAEAVTNAVRHGRGPISLDIEVSGEEVRLELVNTRADASAPADGLGRGVGRGAISHRATAVGGSASSGPGLADAPAPGTWQVLAQLPAHAAGSGGAAGPSSTDLAESTGPADDTGPGDGTGPAQDPAPDPSEPLTQEPPP